MEHRVQESALGFPTNTLLEHDICDGTYESCYFWGVQNHTLEPMKKAECWNNTALSSQEDRKLTHVSCNKLSGTTEVRGARVMWETIMAGYFFSASQQSSSYKSGESSGQSLWAHGRVKFFPDNLSSVKSSRNIFCTWYIFPIYFLHQERILYILYIISYTHKGQNPTIWSWGAWENEITHIQLLCLYWSLPLAMYPIQGHRSRSVLSPCISYSLLAANPKEINGW